MCITSKLYILGVIVGQVLPVILSGLYGSAACMYQVTRSMIHSQSLHQFSLLPVPVPNTCVCPTMMPPGKLSIV